MSDIETKSLSFKMAEDDSLGRFSGDAATYGNVDLAGDIVLPGAFNKYIAENGIHYPLLWSHNQNDVIGSFNVKDLEASLGIEGSFNMDVQRGREGYALLKRGDLKGLSIGYIVRDCDWDQDGHRLLKELELVEVSLVAIPCNPEATAEAKTMSLAKKSSLAELDEETRADFKKLVKEALAEINETEEDPKAETDEPTEEEGKEAEAENNEEDETKMVHDITIELKSILGRD